MGQDYYLLTFSGTENRVFTYVQAHSPPSELWEFETDPEGNPTPFEEISIYKGIRQRAYLGPGARLVRVEDYWDEVLSEGI